MATYTSNYNLTKPTMAESADIRVINGNMDTVDEIMHSTQVSMADAFDSTATYAIRDVVMYEFELYQCIHPHTGAWDANNFVRVNAAEVGGNYVEITPTYNTGLKVADTNIDGDQDEIKVPYMTGATAQADGTGGLVPAPTMQDVGKYLKSDGTWGEPSGGGGGTTVVPNPVGTPTDTLDTIQIGNTIYDIEGSGGGAGKGYETTLIYDSGSNTAGAPTGQDVSLLDNLSKYDLGMIIMSTPSDRAETKYQSSDQVFFDTSYALIDDNYHQLHWAGYGNRWMQIKFTDTTFRITGSGGEDGGHTPNVYKIYGIKFGGGVNRKLIYTLTAGGQWETFSNPNSENPLIVEAYGATGIIASAQIVPSGLPSRDGGDYYRTLFEIPDTGVNVNVATSNAGTTINISASSSYDTTTKYVKVYEVSYGSGGGYRETDLFVNSGSSNPSTIVMAESIQNYDEIVFCVNRTSYGGYKVQYRYTTSEMALGDRILLPLWSSDNEYISYELDAYDTLDIMAQGNALLLTKIIGIKH